MAKNVTIKSKEKVGETPIYSEWKYELNREGTPFTRYRIEMNNNAVAILLFDINSNKVLLPTEFRSGTMQFGQSITAGKIEKEESPEEAAIREVKEETGYDILEVTPVSKYANSEGYSSEITYVFMAKVDSYTNEKHTTNFDKDEDISVEWVDFNAIYDKVISGKLLVSAATILALNFAKSYFRF